MVNLNGSAPKINIGLSLGVLSLMIFTIAVGGYYISETKTIAEHTRTVADEQDKKLTNFIENWEKRITVGNIEGNLTQHRLVGLLENQTNATILQEEQEKQLLNLSRTNDKIIKQQLDNEKQIINNTNNTLTSIELQSAAAKQRVKIQDNILNNLTNHRVITNLTYAKMLENQKTISHLLNKTNALTSEEYAKLADKRVQNIVGNLSADHKAIMKALNITNTTQTEQNKNSTINDKTVQQILDILNKTQ